MEDTFKVIVQDEDFKHSEKYSSPTQCPLARAARRFFASKDLKLGVSVSPSGLALWLSGTPYIYTNDPGGGLIIDYKYNGWDHGEFTGDEIQEMINASKQGIKQNNFTVTFLKR